MKYHVYFAIKNRCISLSQGSKILLGLKYVHIDAVKWIKPEKTRKEMLREFLNSGSHCFITL